MNKQCFNCGALYYGVLPAAHPPQKGHQCRRHPPQMMLIPKGVDLAGNVKMSVDSLWPVVKLDGPEDPGCADWIAPDAGQFIGAPDRGLAS